MAFRKTIVSSYFPFGHVGGFNELSQSLTSVSGSRNKLVGFVSLSAKELSAEALPLIELDSLISSGEIIKGDISLRPSDPARIGKKVNDSVTSYIDRVQSYIDSVDSDKSE